MLLCYDLLIPQPDMQPQVMWQQLQQHVPGSTQSNTQTLRISAAETSPQLSAKSFFEHSMSQAPSSHQAQLARYHSALKHITGWRLLIHSINAQMQQQDLTLTGHPAPLTLESGARLQALGPDGWFSAADCCPFELYHEDLLIMEESHKSGFYAWDQAEEALPERFTLKVKTPNLTHPRSPDVETLLRPATLLWLHMDFCRLRGGDRIGTCVAPLRLRRTSGDYADYKAFLPEVLVALCKPAAAGDSSEGDATETVQTAAAASKSAAAVHWHKAYQQLLTNLSKEFLLLAMGRDVMVDLALFDAAGRQLLGRAGVEIWTKHRTSYYILQERKRQGVDGAGHDVWWGFDSSGAQIMEDTPGAQAFDRPVQALHFRVDELDDTLWNHGIFVDSEKAPVSSDGLPLLVLRVTWQALHTVFKQQELGLGRLILIGDVHGCLRELLQLLDTIKFDYGQDNLIFVGDLVNKGPRSQETAAFVGLLCGHPEQHTWSVRGNHDDAALAAWRQLQQGEPPTDPMLQWVSQLQPRDVNFLKELPFSLTIEGYDIVVVHAGLVPGLHLHAQDLAVMTTIRDVKQRRDGSFIPLDHADGNSQAWAGFWQGPQHVMFGHDSPRRLQTSPPYATGIDSGCCHAGQLTACLLPPLAELQECAAFRQARLRHEPPTIHTLRGYLVSVPSMAEYHGD
eukprot:gene6999-7213_t